MLNAARPVLIASQQRTYALNELKKQNSCFQNAFGCWPWFPHKHKLHKINKNGMGTSAEFVQVSAMTMLHRLESF